jgi:hypothetical protein
MPDMMSVYKIFVASPSDTLEEREIASKVIKEWNELNSSSEKVSLKDLRWEKHACSVLHSTPQDAINEQLLSDADCLIGIFKNKFGLPIYNYPCATVEEIDRHIAANKSGMLFFCKSKIDRSEILKEDNDIAKIEKLKERYKNTVFYEEYDGLDDFEARLKKSLCKTVRSDIKSLGIGTENGTEVVDPDKEFYKNFVTDFCERINIRGWTTWASNLCSTDPVINYRFYDFTLKEINIDLHSKIWPDACPQVKNAFLNISRILSDFIGVYDQHASSLRNNSDVMVYERYYRNRGEFNPLYHQDLKKYEHETCLIERLVLEMTKAANYLCDSIRKELDPSFRKYENKLTLEILDGLSSYTLIPEYTKEDLDSNCLYQGLEVLQKSII